MRARELTPQLELHPVPVLARRASADPARWTATEQDRPALGILRRCELDNGNRVPHRLDPRLCSFVDPVPDEIGSETIT